MAYFFFTDESGTDHQDSFYEVLCGVAIEDRDLWNLISQLKNLEEQILGIRYGNQTREIKGKKFLKGKFLIRQPLFLQYPRKKESSFLNNALKTDQQLPEGIWLHYRRQNSIM